MHVGCAKGRVGGCGGSNAPPEAKSSTSRRIAQRILRGIKAFGNWNAPTLLLHVKSLEGNFGSENSGRTNQGPLGI